MAFKLEDLINKKKEPTQILDLAKVKIKSKEDFEKYFDKIPEFKIRPEKVRPEDAKVRDNDFSFFPTKKEIKARKQEYSYGNPIPTSMKSVRLEDLVAVDISWRMLTMARPKNKLEEDIFSRLVELGKLRLNTRRQEQEQQNSGPSTSSNSSSNQKGGGASSSAGGNNLNIPNNSPQALAYLGIIVSKNKRGVTETRIRSCKECGEELCNGQWCKEFPYDSYTRMILDKDELAKQEAEERGGGQIRRTSKMKEMASGGKSVKVKLVKKKTTISRTRSPKKKSSGVGASAGTAGGVSKLKGKTTASSCPAAADIGNKGEKGPEIKKKRKKKKKKLIERKAKRTTDESGD